MDVEITDEEYRKKISKGLDPDEIIKEFVPEKGELPESEEGKEIILDEGTKPIEEDAGTQAKPEAVATEPSKDDARWDTLMDQLTQFDTRIKETVGRIGAIQGKLDASEIQAQKEKESAPTEEELSIAAKNKEIWDEIQEEQPELAEGIAAKLALEKVNLPDINAIKETVLAGTVEEVSDKFNSQLDEKIQEVITQVTGQLVSSFHPGWEDTVKDSNFLAWIATQNESTLAKYYSDEPAQAISLLDDYEESKSSKTVAEIKEERQTVLDQAVKPETTKTKSTRGKAVEDMTDEEYRAYRFKASSG